MNTTEPFEPIACSIDDAARRIGVSKETINREIKAGHLGAKKVRGRTTIPYQELVNWYNTQQDVN